MSEESQSISAAEKAFRDLFKDGDERMQPAAAKKFLKSYLWAYKDVSRSEYRPDDASILRNMARSRQLLISYDPQKQSFLEHADILGQALGVFMATIDHGILNETFLLDKYTVTVDGIFGANLIVRKITEIATQLQRINVKVDHAIIRRKISFINRHYRGKLPRDKQELLAKMAAAFM